MKKILIFIFSVIAVILTLFINVSADEVISSGNWGDLHWVLNETTGVLYISGNGNMDDFEESGRLKAWLGRYPYIETVIINDGVTSIGAHAFRYCQNLKEIKIPESVKKIDEGAFYYCTGLESIEIPDSVSVIGPNVFNACSGLEAISIPKDITAIEGGTFAYCTKLSEVDLPDGLLIIDREAFHFCRALTNIDIPDTVTVIGSDAFSECTALESVEIPNSLTQMGERAFFRCSSLESIDLPTGLVNIGKEAFSSCTSLTAVRIPEGAVSLGDKAFSHCTALRSAEIPNSLTQMGERIFLGCYALESISVSDGNTDFCSAEGNLFTKDGATLIQYALGKADRTYTVPQGVTSIEAYAFSGCKNIEGVVLPDSVTVIGESAFDSCPELASVTIGKALDVLHKKAFFNCPSIENIYVSENNPKYLSIDGSLYMHREYEDKKGYELIQYTVGRDDTEFILPNNVFNLQEYSFYGCKSLKCITLSSSLSTIDSAAFELCENVSTLYVYSKSIFFNITTNSKISWLKGVKLIVVPKSIDTPFVENGTKFTTSEYFTIDDVKHIAYSDHAHKFPDKICEEGIECFECGFETNEHFSGDDLISRTTTCTKDGTKTAKCKRCDTVFTVDELALGHYIMEATCTTPYKCAREGCEEKYGEPLGHSFSPPTCTVPYKCSRDGCDEETGEALGHLYSAECAEQCQRCYSHLEKTGVPHKLKRSRVIVEPDESLEGYAQYYCTECGEVKMVIISNAGCRGCGGQYAAFVSCGGITALWLVFKRRLFHR